MNTNEVLNKLIAEIERQKKKEGWCAVGSDTADVYYARGFRFACDFTINLIGSLQQEQPEVDIVETGRIRGNLEGIPSNVDLEKEIEGTTGDYAEGRRLEQRILEESRRFPEVSFAKLSRIAKHFYDFGKQERFIETQVLDEAAEENSREYYCSCLKRHNETGICDGCENVKLAFKAGAIWMFEKTPSEQAIAYVKASHSASEVSEFQAAMNIAAAKAFDAGAKWMAEQGETIETRFTKTKFRGLIAIRSFHKDGEYFKNGEEVIIQIRKKEE